MSSVNDLRDQATKLGGWRQYIGPDLAARGDGRPSVLWSTLAPAAGAGGEDTRAGLASGMSLGDVPC